MSLIITSAFFPLSLRNAFQHRMMNSPKEEGCWRNPPTAPEQSSRDHRAVPWWKATSHLRSNQVLGSRPRHSRRIGQNHSTSAPTAPESSIFPPGESTIHGCCIHVPWWIVRTRTGRGWIPLHCLRFPRSIWWTRINRTGRCSSLISIIWSGHWSFRHKINLDTNSMLSFSSIDMMKGERNPHLIISPSLYPIVLINYFPPFVTTKKYIILNQTHYYWWRVTNERCFWILFE